MSEIIKKTEKEKAHLRYLRYKNYPEYKTRQRKNNIKRRAHKKNVNEIISSKDIQFIKNQFNNKCFNCGSTDRLELDHYYPLSAGYKLSIGNGIILCRRCNTIKNNKLPQYFFSPIQILVLEVFYNKINGSLNDVCNMYCVICGKEMNHIRPLKKPICSHECKLKYKAQQQREHYHKDIIKSREYNILRHSNKFILEKIKLSKQENLCIGK